MIKCIIAGLESTLDITSSYCNIMESQIIWIHLLENKVIKGY